MTGFEELSASPLVYYELLLSELRLCGGWVVYCVGRTASGALREHERCSISESDIPEHLTWNPGWLRDGERDSLKTISFFKRHSCMI